MNYRYFVLGLLAQQSMSGYDIKRCFESFGWLIRSPSFGSLYPALHALQEDGCLTMQVVEGESGLSRKVYTITEVGQQALEKWIHESMEHAVKQPLLSIFPNAWQLWPIPATGVK